MVEWTRRKIAAVVIGGGVIIGLGNESDEEESEGTTEQSAGNGGGSEGSEGEANDGEGINGREWAADLSNSTTLDIFGYSEQDIGSGVQAFMDAVTPQPGGLPSDAEIAEVAGGYSTYVDRDPNAPKQLFVEVYNTENGDPTATFEIQREWARDYLAGEITEIEYANRAVETMSIV